MSQIFEKTFHVGWANVDFNGHLGNTSFMDLAVDVRMFYFAENGFPIQEFQRQRFGPVSQKWGGLHPVRNLGGYLLYGNAAAG